MKNSLLRLFFVLSLLLVSAAVPSLRAEDLGAVKARISARLSKIDELKAKGAIGENIHGLVEVRGDDAEAAGVVAAENSDRQAVYAAIGKQTGASAEQVGRSRAKQIAANSAAGVWLQRDDGSWYKK
jgi:uncharacterized protein YdbL (DUF1318 family)